MKITIGSHNPLKLEAVLGFTFSKLISPELYGAWAYSCSTLALRGAVVAMDHHPVGDLERFDPYNHQRTERVSYSFPRGE
jgi:hypothetical protein